MSIKLSICIPTYNRANYLEETIESILPQLDNESELVISDNASSDNTQVLVKSYMEKYKNITYFRWENNQGPDKNYYNAVAKAQGEYCWLLGSDDLLTDDAIRRVKDFYLRKYKDLDFILVTSEVYDISLRKLLYLSKEELNLTEDLYYDNAYDFFVKFFCESGLSGYIVKRDEWMSADYKKYLDTGLVYLGIVYEYLKEDSKVLVISEPCVKYRSGNGCWTKDLFRIQIELMKNILDAIPSHYKNYKQEAWLNYKRRIPISLRNLLSCRLAGIYTYNEYKRYLRYYYDSPIKKFFGLIIAFIPRVFLKSLKLLVKGKS